MKPRAIILALLMCAPLGACRSWLKGPPPPPPQKRWCKKIAGPEAMSHLHAVWAQHQSASLVLMGDAVFECPCDPGKPASAGEEHAPPDPPDGGNDGDKRSGEETRSVSPGAEGRRLSGGDEQIACWKDEICRGYKVSGLATARFYDGLQLVDALDRCIH